MCFPIDDAQNMLNYQIMGFWRIYKKHFLQLI